MTVQPDLCRTCLETTLLVFSRDGSFILKDPISDEHPQDHLSSVFLQKFKVDNDQKMAQSERNSHFKNQKDGENMNFSLIQAKVMFYKARLFIPASQPQNIQPIGQPGAIAVLGSTAASRRPADEDIQTIGTIGTEIDV